MDGVILLHGLGRSHWSMRRLQHHLSHAGYITANFTYPSTRYPIETLASLAIKPSIAHCQKHGIQRIHFVTHSMGGILVRYYLSNQLPKNLEIGRVVMLAPPNHGSEIVDKFSAWQLFRWWNGPAGQQLGTSKTSLPNQLGPALHEVGIIAGNRQLDPLSWFIPGDSDGKVSVASARLSGMTDFLVLPVSHTFIMRNTRAMTQTLHFLKHGRFQAE